MRKIHSATLPLTWSLTSRDNKRRTHNKPLLSPWSLPAVFLLTLCINIVLMTRLVLWENSATPVSQQPLSKARPRPSSSLFHLLPHNRHGNDADPFDGLVVHGRREYYKPVPAEARRRFKAVGKAEDVMRRIMGQFVHWTEADDRAFHIYNRFQGDYTDKVAKSLQSWQRYSRIPFYATRWDSKDDFLAGFREYARRVDQDLWFLPETYRITADPWDRQAFQHRLDFDEATLAQPWVLKNVNLDNGDGIEILPPHSEALLTAVDRAYTDYQSTYVIQKYMCNELTWFGGQKFDLRMYWLVLSIDPLIVLMADGFARVSKAAYNESDWSTTHQHVTSSPAHRNDTYNQDVTHEHLWQRVRQHHAGASSTNRVLQAIDDPVQHVKRQMKEAIGHFAAAFSPDMLRDARWKHREENFFGFYGCDFIIDADLDVWLIETQSSPRIGDSPGYRRDMWDRLLPPMIDMVEELALKQAANASANLLPLKSIAGGWELVYADRNIFHYQGYERSDNKPKCSVQ